MKFTKKSDVVVMKLDSDDLVPLMARDPINLSILFIVSILYY